MVQNNGELVAGDAGIKFEMIFASQEMLYITYCIGPTYHNLFTIYSIYKYHSKYLGVGSMDSMDWTFVRNPSTMKWPISYAININLMTYDPEQNQPHLKSKGSLL